MKTRGILLVGVAVFSFTGLVAQPYGKEYRKNMEEDYREMRKADEEYYRETAKAEAEYAWEMQKEREEYYRERSKRERKAYEKQMKRERKMRKKYAKHARKGKGYPVYYRDAYYVESPRRYRRSPGVAIDGEVVFRNGSIRVGYYD